MSRLLKASLILWSLVLLLYVGQLLAAIHTVTIHERVSMSRTCPGEGNHWYVDESDANSVLMVCSYNAEDDEDTPAGEK